MTKRTSWWQKTTIYQIYPRSFHDTNKNGIGDLAGIITKLDHVKMLGFETIWLSPFYNSPQQDFGYDVSDYLAIDGDYGTMAETEALIEEIHNRGMRVIFDLVLNHTSNQHPWFQESRSSKESPRRDWYIWRDGKGKNPPNNWRAIPGGSGWHFDELTEQYYYASFLPFQPDLNWRNPDVKKAMFAIARYWLDKGVDGFRLDIFHTVFKDERMRDNPFSFRYTPTKDLRDGFFQHWRYTQNRPEVYKLAAELRKLIQPYKPERMLIGEVYGNTQEKKRFLGDKEPGLNLIFLWELLDIKSSAREIRQVIEHYERQFPYPHQPVFVFGNHDQKRLMTRIKGSIPLAKLLTLMQFTLRGVAVTYYGEEIGMTDADFPASTALDPIGQRYSVIPKMILDFFNVYTNRDGCRTPMQWEDAPNAGFCEVEVRPWLPVQENYPQINAASQLEAADSLLNTYLKVIRLRNEEEILQTGSLQLISIPGLDKDLVVYERKNKFAGMLVVMNFSKGVVNFQNTTDYDKTVLAVGMEKPVNSREIRLAPYGGLVLKSGKQV